MRFEDFVQNSIHAQSVDCLTRNFIAYIGDFGFHRFMLGELSQPTMEEKESRLTLMANYPADWLDRYLSRHYVECDPVYQETLRMTRPFRWSDLPMATRGSLARQVMEEAAEFGLRSGVGMSFPQPRGRLVGIGLSTSESSPRSDPYALGMISAAVHQLVASYSALVIPDGSSPPCLTPREREILLWIASGRSKADVAHFLNLSEASVKRHCENFSRKLGTSTLAAAVAQSIRWALIDPF